MSKEFLIGHLMEFFGVYIETVPLRIQLRKFYNRKRHLGSRDRKTLSDLIYSYFRVTAALPEASHIEAACIGSFLQGTEYYIAVAGCSKIPEGADPVFMSMEERLKMVLQQYPNFDLQNSFPMVGHISSVIDKTRFLNAGMLHGNVYIRCRKRFVEAVTEDLEKNAIIYKVYTDDPHILRIINPGKLQRTSAYERGYFEIQDPGSMRVLQDLRFSEGQLWWDACCGSGGKSLALIDRADPIEIKLFASDIRSTEEENYKSRLSKAGQFNFEFCQMDLTAEINIDKMFDGMIVDAPCSGSGTWHNAPENKGRITMDAVKDFHLSQVRILKNVSKYLNKGGQLLYVTCSVYKIENEDVTEILNGYQGLNSVAQGYVKGYHYGADTFYYNLFTK